MIRSPSTGIILNDQMDDFSYPGFKNGFGQPYSEVNAPSYKKRPMSSMVPSIVVSWYQKFSNAMTFQKILKKFL